MEGNWDSYLLNVDDRPASIFVDLGAQKTAPRRELPVMAYLRLHMNAPRPDGLSSREEFDALVAVEKALEAGLVGSECAYVGRCTTNSCRDFYFYRADTAGWEARVGECMGTFPAYRYETESRPDEGWTAYLEFLHPSGEQMQSIENRRILDVLGKHGDPLTAMREIDHWIVVDDSSSIRAIVGEAAELGFALHEQFGSEGMPSSQTVQLRRVDVPSRDRIDAIVLPLYRIAIARGATYDGWGTVIVGPPAEADHL